MEYINKAPEETECFLCQKPLENDDVSNLILYRGKSNFIILNVYPYNTGHLMVAPYRHIGDPSLLTEAEGTEHLEMVKLALRVLKQVMSPEGFNIGMNLGRAAGAGVADHIHTHIVPRWQGDTNFMPTIADTKVLPESLSATYQKLKQGLESLRKKS